MVARRPIIRRRSDRGAVAVTTALFLPVMFGFFAIAFNVGLMMDSRSELQNGSDAAALAAARSLDGTAAGLTSARQAAYNYSIRHRAFDQEITIDAFNADLTFGRWHLVAADCKFGSTGRDCFETVPTAEPRKITAVRIRNGRDGGTHNAPLDVLFGAFLGATTVNVRSAAVAIGGGAAVPGCALPLAIAECKIVNGAGQLNCGPAAAQLVFSNANADAVGFANLTYPADQQAPSGTFVADVIRNGMCTPTNQIGPAKLQNGNDFAKPIDALRGVDNKGKVIGSCLIGEVTSMPVTDAGCPGNPIFQGVQEVVGFVKTKIVAVTDNHGNALGCPGDAAPVISGKPKNAMIVEIPCAAPSDPGEWGGGRAYNTPNVRTRLVQ